MLREKIYRSLVDHLSNKTKAAIILLYVDQEQAARLLSLMSDDSVRLASKEMTALGVVTPDLSKRVGSEFLNIVRGVGTVGGQDSTKKLLSKVYTEDKRRNLLANKQKTVWERFDSMAVTVFADFLMKEHPQVAAVVLSKIGTKHAASTIDLLHKQDEKFAVEVLLRMVRLNSVSQGAIESIEKSLSEQFSTTEAEPRYALLASIFNNLESGLETRLLSSIEVHESHTTKKIRSLMFIFEDLIHLDSVKIQTIVRNVDKTLLATALKDASKKLTDHILQSMPERARNMIGSVMEGLGKVRAKDAHAAQSRILDAVRDLAAEGAISLPSKREVEEEMVG